MDCHDQTIEAGFTATNSNCIQCHVQPDMDPSHNQVPGYAWTGADPDFCRTCHPSGVGNGHPESQFPIETGPHNEPCLECHIQSTAVGYTGNVSCTSTLGCHQHSQGETDGHHEGESGYVYDTAACLDCHPRGLN